MAYSIPSWCGVGVFLALIFAMPPAFVPNAGNADLTTEAEQSVADRGIVHVTTLADSGAGSLREALALSGKRTVVFDVGGTIRLSTNLKITQPFITIAGQTAPSPGITLLGAPLRIRTHDVRVEHIAVRPGPAPNSDLADNWDGIGIDGSGDYGLSNSSQRVVLRNVSVSWSVDEAVSLWFPATRDVTVTQSIIAEALNQANHPKGPHSMGLLVGPSISGVTISGNLFASNMYRNPAMSAQSSTAVVNNLIVNPGQNAIHFYTDTQSIGPSIATIANNVIEAGPDTKTTLKAIILPAANPAQVEPDRIYVSGNVFRLDPRAIPLWPENAITVSQPPVEASDWQLIDADAVRASVLRYAGSRPGDRNAVDRLLMSNIANGTLRLLDTPPLELAVEQSTSRVAEPPSDPEQSFAGSLMTRLDAWLCREHLKVGGAPYETCPAEAIGWTF